MNKKKLKTFKSVTLKHLYWFGALVLINIIAAVLFSSNSSETGSGMILLVVDLIAIPAILLSWIISVLTLKKVSNDNKKGKSKMSSNSEIFIVLIIISFALYAISGLFEEQIKDISDGLLTVIMLIANIVLVIAIVKILTALIKNKRS